MIVFPEPGKANSEKTLEIAVQAARERGIKHLVVASNRGETAKLLAALDTQGLNVTIVSTQCGSFRPNESTLPAERRAEFEARGWHVVHAGHALSSGERSLSTQFGGVYPLEIVAYTLRMFGAGTKVSVEIAVMAADAGWIPTGEPVICVAGSGGGADTALILRAAGSNRLLDTRIDEILCKPIPRAAKPPEPKAR